MQIPVLSILILIFIIWFQYEIRKNKRITDKGSDQFWQAEQAANLTRRKDISDLPYITIPLDRLPMMNQEDPDLNSYRDTIQELSGRKILNLAGQTNRDLKLSFGAANFNYLMECDNNFITFISTLQKWGERFYHLGYIPEAVTVLEYAVDCSTDVSKTYCLLARIYTELNTPESIDNLIHVVSSSSFNRKDDLLRELNIIKNYYE